MRRRTVLISGLVSLAAAIPLVAAAAPASAATVTCQAHAVCVYKNAAFNGGSYVWIQGDLDSNFNAATAITFQPSGGKVNDNISALINNTSRTVQFCTDASFKGTCFNFAPGYAYSPVPDNDTYSSMRFV